MRPPWDPLLALETRGVVLGEQTGRRRPPRWRAAEQHSNQEFLPQILGLSSNRDGVRLTGVGTSRGWGGEAPRAPFRGSTRGGAEHQKTWA